MSDLQVGRIEQLTTIQTGAAHCVQRVLSGYVVTTPKEHGFYWCLQHHKVRIVKVWGNKYGTYTNEDGGAAVSDPIYDGAKWCGPIKPPQAI